jgi:hypothetical protein
MITSLTEQQIEQMPEFVKKWIDIGLCTEPIDKEMAAEGVKQSYSICGLKEPLVVFLESPYQLCYGHQVLTQVWDQVRDQVWAQVGAQVGEKVRVQVWAQVGDQVGDQVRNQVWVQIGDQVRAQVRDQVRDQVMDQVWDQVWDQIGDQVGEKVWTQVWTQVRTQVRDQVRDQVRIQVGTQIGDQVRTKVRDQVWAQVLNQIGDQVGEKVINNINKSDGEIFRKAYGGLVYGQHETWLSFYDYLQYVGIDTSKLDGLYKMAESSGWWLPYKNVAFVSDRPNKIHLDDQGRLHCEDEAAIQYRDGWGVYAIHGVRVPEYIILHPGEITTEKIESEANVEIRRIMLDRYGWDRYLLEKGEVISTDKYGTLYRKITLDDEPIVMVKVKNSTPEPDGSYKDYLIRVPPETRTAKQAVAWTFGETSETYQPIYES